AHFILQGFAWATQFITAHYRIGLRPILKVGGLQQSPAAIAADGLFVFPLWRTRFATLQNKKPRFASANRGFAVL
ncbi:MAG TPA: hypothetical protein VLL95_04615, partial [Phnomibacter sp.]|nr:hypothetical protein [Phnomibacter sp.]